MQLIFCNFYEVSRVSFFVVWTLYKHSAAQIPPLCCLLMICLMKCFAINSVLRFLCTDFVHKCPARTINWNYTWNQIETNVNSIGIWWETIGKYVSSLCCVTFLMELQITFTIWSNQSFISYLFCCLVQLTSRDFLRHNHFFFLT